MRRSFVYLLIVIVVAFAAGCGGDSSGENAGSSEEASCTPDPDLIDDQRSCQSDDRCPCGTHCDLGRCTFECTSADDCSDGQRCDEFGRCRLTDDGAMLPLPDEQGQGRVSVDRTRLHLDAGDEKSIEIAVEEHRIERARVSAERGVEIRCPEQQEYGDECILVDLSVDDAVSVTVRRTESNDPEDVPEVTVYGPANRATVMVPRFDQLGYVPPADRPEEPLEGRYTGVIELDAVGTDADLDDLSDAPIPTRFQVDARVWDDGGESVIAIDDPNGALTSHAQLIGTLELSGDASEGLVDGSASFEDHPFAEAEVSGRTNRLIAATEQAPLRSRLGPRSLSMSLTQIYEGQGTQVSPAVRWSVELQRTDDNSAALPSREHLPAEVGYDAGERLDAAAPWIQAYRAEHSLGYAELAAHVESSGHTEFCGLESTERTDFEKVASRYLMAAEYKNPDGSTDFEFSNELIALYDEAIDDFIEKHNDYARQIDEDFRYNYITWGNSGGPAEFGEPPELDGGLACAFSDYTITYDNFFAFDSDVSIAGVATRNVVDFCDELEAATGCQVETEDTTFEATQTHNATLHHNSGSFRSNRLFELEGTVTKVCKLPSSHASCGEGLSCVSSEETTSAAYVSAGFGDEQLAGSQDLACSDNGLAGGLALDRHDDLEAREAVQNCIDELDALDTELPEGESPDAIFDVDAKCVDIGRTLAAIGAQSMTLRPGDVPLADDEQLRASTYTQRLLTRWLEVHGFVAGETEQVELMANHIIANVEGDAYQLPRMDQAIERTTAGWDIFLEPHTANAVFEMPTDALIAPDYRPHYHDVGEDPDGDQDRALPAAILETLDRQSNLLERFAVAEEVGPNADTNYLVDWMPRMLLAQAMAADLKRRVDAADTAPEWADGYERQLERSRASVLDSVELYAAIYQGANPLGIEDSDLPLYHTADDSDGETDRFSAITDYIAGVGDRDDQGWAPRAIADAEVALGDAEDVYKFAAERQWRDGLSDAIGSEDGRIADIKATYNDQLYDFCGPHLRDGEVDYSPIEDPEFDARSCSITDKPECTFDAGDRFEAWREADIVGRLCEHHESSRASVNDMGGFVQQEMRDFARGCYGPQIPESGAVSIVECASTDSVYCLRCDWKDDVDDVEVTAASLELGAPRTGARSEAESESASDGAAGAAHTQASQDCEQRHPDMRTHIPLAKSPLETPGCVNGALGEANLDVVAAAQDVQIANDEIAEHTEAFGNAKESCYELVKTNDELEDARARHKSHMEDLYRDKAIADGIAAGAAAVKDCANSMQSAKGVKGYALGGVACGAAATEGAANITSVKFQHDIDTSKQAHDNELETIAADGEEKRCFIEAQQELVGIETGRSRLRAAAFALERAQANADEQTAEAQRIYERGHAYLNEHDREGEDAGRVDPAGDQWAQPDIETYVRKFNIAKRATYLAIRAVEYEYQQSVQARQLVLTAKLPDQLNEALDQVWAITGTRNIGGNSPSELTEVVSLRDDILGLSDESNWPEYMHAMSAEERFRAVLTSSEHAVYDADGSYLGQHIPFEIAPLETLDIDGSGAGIYSRTDCAERLWSIDAGIVGEDAAVGGSRRVRLDVSQRNSFYSQWCEASDGADDFQYASVRPSRNLFRVPGDGAFEGSVEAEDSVQAFSTARLQAQVGIDEASLESQQDSSGSSIELATRGLYGDYAIFIDQANISRDGEDGLDLEKVDDILLRLDYLSVAK